MANIRTLIVDDNAIWLTVVKTFLDQLPGIQVVGTAKDGYEALTQALSLQPDLVIMDIVMPVMDGLTSTRQLKAMPNAPCVVIDTLFGNPAYESLAYEAGADGYIDKAELAEKLPPLIQELFSNPPR